MIFNYLTVFFHLICNTIGFNIKHTNVRKDSYLCNMIIKIVKNFNSSAQTMYELPGGWWQSKSALSQSKDSLFFRMASTLFMSLFTLASLIFESNLLHEKIYVPQNSRQQRLLYIGFELARAYLCQLICVSSRNH